jgi:hypothetical protein
MFSRANPVAEKILWFPEERASANISSAILVRRFRSFGFIGVLSQWVAECQHKIGIGVTKAMSQRIPLSGDDSTTSYDDSIVSNDIICSGFNEHM